MLVWGVIEGMKFGEVGGAAARDLAVALKLPCSFVFFIFRHHYYCAFWPFFASARFQSAD